MERATRLIMGMPVTVCVVDAAGADCLEAVFRYFRSVDRQFSPFLPDSEVCRYAAAQIPVSGLSEDLQEVFDLAAQTRRESYGAFDVIRPDGRCDPSGIVKGWAIRRAAELLREMGNKDFYIDAGGDVQTSGRNPQGEAWSVGIRNPFVEGGVVKVLALSGNAVATSGTYARGDHIYDPRRPDTVPGGLLSLSVVAADIVDADRFATAAFAMGEEGIYLIEETEGLEGFAIGADGYGTKTSGFREHEIK